MVVGQRVRLANQAVATSGDYRNFRYSGEQRFSHTIDPRTAEASGQWTGVCLGGGRGLHDGRCGGDCGDGAGARGGWCLCRQNGQPLMTITRDPQRTPADPGENVRQSLGGFSAHSASQAKRAEHLGCFRGDRRHLWNCRAGDGRGSDFCEPAGSWFLWRIGEHAG